MHILTFVECLPCVYTDYSWGKSPLVGENHLCWWFSLLFFSMGDMPISDEQFAVGCIPISQPWWLGFSIFFGVSSLLRLRSYLARTLIELSRKSLPGNGKSFVRWDIWSFLPWQISISMPVLWPRLTNQSSQLWVDVHHWTSHIIIHTEFCPKMG